MKKSEYILSINPCIYGMNYHDPGAAIILDGEILFAIEEERLNGIKGSKGFFPELSIKACLDYCGIDKNQISCITIGYNPELWMKRLQLELEDIIDKCQKNQEVESIKVMNRIIDSNLVAYSMDTINYDERYVKIVQDFERQKNAYVYHVVEAKTQDGYTLLSLLFVGDREEDWITERLDGNSIFTFTICVENPEYSAFGEFGWILMDSPMGYLMRTA